MWPFGKKKIDFDGLGLELLGESAKYLKPTVDALYRYLEESGQLQYRDELTEKRILNAAGAGVVIDLVLRQAARAAGGNSEAGRQQLTAGFDHGMRRLADQSFAEHRLRLDEGRELLDYRVPGAMDEYPRPARDAREESLAYEMARTVLRLHLQWSSSNGDLLALPTAADDWSILSEAADGLARSQRWIEQSLGKQIRTALA